MIVMLPMIIWGAPTDGNTVVEGPPVIAPGSADVDGVDCWDYSQFHKLIWFRMGDIAETKAENNAGRLPALTGAMVKLAVIAANGTLKKVLV